MKIKLVLHRQYKPTHVTRKTKKIEDAKKSINCKLQLNEKNFKYVNYTHTHTLGSLRTAW